jgi:hypothetical protein
MDGGRNDPAPRGRYCQRGRYRGLSVATALGAALALGLSACGGSTRPHDAHIRAVDASICRQFNTNVRTMPAPMWQSDGQPVLLVTRIDATLPSRRSNLTHTDITTQHLVTDLLHHRWSKVASDCAGYGVHVTLPQMAGPTPTTSATAPTVTVPTTSTTTVPPTAAPPTTALTTAPPTTAATAVTTPFGGPGDPSNPPTYEWPGGSANPCNGPDWSQYGDCGTGGGA